MKMTGMSMPAGVGLSEPVLGLSDFGNPFGPVSTMDRMQRGQHAGQEHEN